jgi:hypothetical protein
MHPEFFKTTSPPQAQWIHMPALPHPHMWRGATRDRDAKADVWRVSVALLVLALVAPSGVSAESICDNRKYGRGLCNGSHTVDSVYVQRVVMPECRSFLSVGGQKGLTCAPISLRRYLESESLSGTIPPQLSQLSQLEYLWFKDSSLSGTIPTQLGQLTNLEYLCARALYMPAPHARDVQGCGAITACLTVLHLMHTRACTTAVVFPGNR